MKRLIILEDVALPHMPAFRKGSDVNVSDTPKDSLGGKSIAQILVERGHAKEEKGKSRSQVRREQVQKDAKEGKEPKPDVTVTKKKGDEVIPPEK